MWRDMRIADVYGMTACDLLRAPPLTLGMRLGGKPSLVDAGPLAELVRTRLPWDLVRRTIDTGAVDAFVVAATDVDNGRTVLFVDRNTGGAEAVSTHPEQIIVPTQMRPKHCLASAAMPFLFPPIEIAGRLLVDGGLRLNTPLSPALHLGADRLLVVGTQASPRESWGHLRAADLSLGHLVGKAMTALLFDPIEQDLRRLELVNGLLDAGEEAFGAGFLDRLNPVACARRKAPFRRVDSVLVRPSEDLGAIAGAAWRSGRIQASPATRLLLSAVAAAERPEEADLLSFLLFDQAFTAEVEDLGHRDAEAQEGAIARLFGLGSQN